MTKKTKEMMVLRDATYHVPAKRCGNCKFFWEYGNNCQLVEDRGRVVNKKVDVAGICSVWEERQ